jgi:butyryl-CoA dehydrogenase
MDFQLSDDQRLLRDSARDFAEGVLMPKSARWDREDSFPWENIAPMAEVGFLGISLPTEFGGGGGTVLDVVLVKEQVARVCRPSSFIVAATTGLGAKAIMLFGTEAQRQEYLPKITAGQLLIAWGMTEPDAGSDIGSMKTAASESGDGYVVTGQKTFISLCHVAHMFLVIARFGGTPGLEGLGAILVPRETPGCALGAKIETMGMRGSAMGEVFFNECLVPRENVLIPPGGFRSVLGIMSSERVAGNPPVSLGIAQAALDATIPFLQQRVQFGRKLAEFQGLQWMLADMVIKLDAARLLVYRAAANAEKGLPSILESAIAKTAANEAAVDISNTALQMHGASGYTTALPLERLVRDARGMAIGDGTVQIQRNLIASQVLRAARGAQS